MSMISAYLYLVWWLLPPGLVLWWARVKLMTPWARYVSHTVIPARDNQPENFFLTVRHVRWWPPFADYDTVYRSFWQTSTKRYWWAEESTGRQIPNDCDVILHCIVEIAQTRQRETEELIK